MNIIGFIYRLELLELRLELDYDLELRTKQTVPCESTAEEVSFEWSHHRVSSTESKVRTTYKTNGTM